MAFFKKKKVEKIEYLKAKDLREEYKITSQKLHEALELLNWVSKSEKRGWITTKLGVTKGAVQRQHMGTDYVIWNTKVKNNFELINTVKRLKVTQKMTNKEKGDLYEKFIATHYRVQGYTIAEHGKDNGVKDGGIDIIAKKGKEMLFIQCKNWSAESTRKIKSEDMKIARQNVQDYKSKNPLYDMYSMKILYVISENVLHGSAYHYLQENSELMEFRIIPIV